MKKLLHSGAFYAATIALFSLAACEKDVSVPVNPDEQATVNARGGYGDDDKAVFYALTGGMTLDKLSGKEVLGSVSITGLQSGESVRGIDFRPATGQLYGLGSTSRLYVINPTTGVARAIGAAPFTPALAGTFAGFDFNPTVDRIRVVTNTGQNFRLNPETGAVVGTDVPINGPAGAMVAAVAYRNNVAGATTTVLYDIDLTTKKLYRQDLPNAGTLVEIGPLRLNITGEGGFDIAADGYKGIALFEVDGKSTLFSVELQSGKTKVLAKYTKKYTAIAIPTRPVAYAVAPTNTLTIFGLPIAKDRKYGEYDDDDDDYDDDNKKDNVDDKVVLSKPLTNLQPGETVVGIDFRPLNGQLYAVGSTSRVYTINTASGVVTTIGTLSTPLNGTHFGIDFNPAVDRLRIISNTGQNLRFNPNDGVTVADMQLNPATTGVTAAAYTNNFAGTTSTLLFDIDVNTDKLYLQNPPNTGTLVDRGSLGVNVDAATGFDIGGFSGTAYALLTSGGKTKLYTLNTMTGKATPVSSFPSTVNGLAVGLGF